MVDVIVMDATDHKLAGLSWSAKKRAGGALTHFSF